jgi:hypothetical protein
MKKQDKNAREDKTPDSYQNSANRNYKDQKAKKTAMNGNRVDIYDAIIGSTTEDWATYPKKKSDDEQEKERERERDII